MRLDKLFYWLGYNISKHPVTTILLSVCIVGFITSGLMFLSFEVMQIII